MNIALVRDCSASHVALALQIGKEMTYDGLVKATKLGRRTVERGVNELRKLEAIQERVYDNPLYGSSKLVFSLIEPLTIDDEKEYWERAREADESGNNEVKLEALGTILAEWFPASDGWGRVFPAKLKKMLRLGKGSVQTVLERLEDSNANPEIRDDSQIKTRKNLGSYLVGILENKRLEPANMA